MKKFVLSQDNIIPAGIPFSTKTFSTRRSWRRSCLIEGSALIVAGAGTEKTRTLVYRVARLVESRVVDLTEILLLTFTRRAASEMLRRASQILDERCRHMG